ncbi:MAG: Gfo/Idh/MocA family protein [Rhodopirellula sp. JB044]|uniref:Gfo/Idh/MocA family protein n=1 Tax=Rhodopirellula sp. JB044 TaxID=3342844 RepID=UPI00370BECC5
MPHSNQDDNMSAASESFSTASQTFSPASQANPSESRRRFLRGGLATTASALSVSHLHANETPAVHQSTSDTSSSSEPIRIALIGCGGRGTGALNDSMSINDNVKLVALADLREEKCERTRKAMLGRHKEKVDVADDKMHAGLDAYKRVLDDPEVDLVLLTTSPGFRPSHLAEAVDAGKHIFAEKPTCVDVAGYHTCLAAHDRAVTNGTAIVTGTQYRRQTNYVAAVEQIRQGAIGDIVSATSRYCSNSIWFKNRQPGMSELDYQLNNWMHFIWLSGDQIVEQAVHNIDAMNWVMGSAPETAYGSGGRFTRPDDSEMWDSMSIDYQYPGNRVLSFMCRQIPNTKSANGNVIYGTEGTMYIDALSRGSRMMDRKGNEVWSAKGSISDAYRQEHKDLVDSITSGKPIVELKETAKSSLTAVMGRLAAYTGQQVTWDFLTKKSTLDLFPDSLSPDNFPASSGHAIPGQTKLT